MTRRTFFSKSLAALAGTASVSPLIFIPKFEPVKWKRAVLTQRMLDETLLMLGEPFDPKNYLGTWEWIVRIKD